MSAPDLGEWAPVESGPAERLQDRIKTTMLTGAAVTVPLIITVLVLALVVEFIVGLMSPVVGVLRQAGIAGGVQDVVIQVLSLLVLLALVFVVGAVAERRPEDGAVTSDFDAAMERIPGVGTVYTSVNRMSEVLLASDTGSFQEVKLVEFPHEEAYAIGFLTAQTPDPIEDAAGHPEMVTVFVPLAPNPFMGGHLLSVPADRVEDVDMTVEEGVQAVVTSGVATDERAEDR